MGNDLAGVDKGEHDDIMACVGGIQEAKDIVQRVMGETQGPQESDKTMHLQVMRVQKQVNNLQQRVSGSGCGERPDGPGKSSPEERLDLGPVLRDMTNSQTRVGTLEDKVAHMAHHGVVQRVVA